MPYTEQKVTSKHRWSDNTFTFTTTRPPGFEFRNGEFVTLGLRPEGKLIPRAYSIVSTNQDEFLEFLSIQVPDGPLTSHLAQIEKGDTVWINTKSTGSLTLGHIQPGRHLYMLATGTGLAPFMSLIRGGEVYESFERVILVHTVRATPGLAYREELESRSGKQFLYLPTVTREPFATSERGADLFRTGRLAEKLGLPAIESEPIMLYDERLAHEMADYLNANGWTMTNYKGPGNFAVEQAFVLQN